MKKTFWTAALTLAVFAFSSGAWAAPMLGATAVSPIYVVDADGDHGVDSMDAAYAFLEESAVPADGVLTVRVCANIAVTGDISVDLSGKEGLTHLVIEGGSYSSGASHSRDDTVIQISGVSLVSGATEPADAAGIADIKATLPANAILEVRNLRFVDSIEFDATGIVMVHDCQVDGGWYVPAPAAVSYVFSGNHFSPRGFAGAAVALYYKSTQTWDLNVDFRGNTVESFRALETSSNGNTDKATNIRVADNTFIHSSVTKAAYDQLDAESCKGLCAIAGKVNGEVEVSGNKVLGYFDVSAALLASTSIAAGSNVAVTNNDFQCNIKEVSCDAAGATIADNRKVHLYPSDTGDHSSVCHICTACRQAIVRVEVTNGRIDSGVENPAIVVNYSGSGYDIGTKSTANACVVDVGATNTVVVTGYEGELSKYIYEGLVDDMDFTLGGWPHTGNTYTLMTINNDNGKFAGAKLVRCPCMKITFKQNYVRSANIHAMVKVEAASTNVLIAVPWTGYTQDGSPSVNLPVNRLVRPLGLSEGDMLLNIVDSRVYEAWMLMPENETEGARLVWTPATSVVDSNPSGAKSVGSIISEKEPAVDRPIPRGTGLWLLRTDPQTEDEEWKPFYLFGQWTKGGALVKIDGGTTGTNSVMVAHPGCTRDLAINTDIRWDGVSAEDTLSIPNGTDAASVALWDAAEGKWWKSKTVRSGRRVISSRDYDITVPAGQGFWYTRRASSPVTIEFVEK